MAFNLYEAYLVGRERRADAMRDAEHWRLVKSLKQEGSSRGRPQRLSLRRPAPARYDDEGGKPRPEARQTVSSPTL